MILEVCLIPKPVTLPPLEGVILVFGGGYQLKVCFQLLSQGRTDPWYWDWQAICLFKAKHQSEVTFWASQAQQ